MSSRGGASQYAERAADPRTRQPDPESELCSQSIPIRLAGYPGGITRYDSMVCAIDVRTGSHWFYQMGAIIKTALVLPIWSGFFLKFPRYCGVCIMACHLNSWG